MENITYPWIVDYINTIQKDWGENLAELEEYAQQNHVPIVQKEVSRFLYVLGLIKKPKAILEIGTAIGYSAAIMAQTLAKDGKIVTIERDQIMYEQAVKNVDKLGIKDKIEIIKGDAIEVLTDLDGEFDLIFIDASKGHYMEFFNHAKRMIKKDGLIISDNVLFKGMIANDELASRNKRTIVNRMRNFLTEISNDKEFETSVIPIGDGIALSLKR